MMKKGYLKSLSAAMLAAVLVLSNAMCVAAEEPNDTENPVVTMNNDGSGNDVSGGNAEDVTFSQEVTETPTAEKIQLAAPTGIYWGYNYTICFNQVTEAQGYYDLELYGSGEKVYDARWHMGGDQDIVSINLDQFITESGDYQVKLRASNRYDDKTYSDSEWVESPVKTYTRPATELGTTKGYWDDETPGLFHYYSVENAGGYEITLFYINPSTNDVREMGGMTRRFGRNYTEEAGVIGTVDLSSFIEERGAGRYAATVRAISSNIDNIANGETGEFSDYYDTTQTASQIKNTLKDALSKDNASEALAAVEQNVSKSALKTAMQTDPETLNQVKSLEERYTKEKNITVQSPTVSDAAASYVDANKIGMVGAGLNAEAGTMQLSVGVPQKTEYVNHKYYKDTVQLAIELKNDNDSVHELAVPVTITMPIPAGLSADKLAILHYHQDGSVEDVSLKNNGDGTVTFTVTSFSTFVFAEKAEETEDTPSKEETTDNSGNSESSGSVSHDWNDITVNVDWTAESAKLDTAIQAANGTNVNVLTGKDVKVSEDILKKLAGKKATLALQAGNSVSLSISGQNNKQIKGDLNLTVTNKDTIPAQAKNAVLAGALTSKNILITENSPLQLRTNLHVGFENKFAGKYANLYYYDAKSGQMNLVGVYQINKDGQSMFALSHGGQYVVTVTDTASKAAVSADGYTVVSGDTLSRIAVKLGTTLKALKAANPQIADVNKIHPGQVIKVQ